MIIWDAGHPVTRLEIEYQLPVDRQLSATTILSFLSQTAGEGLRGRVPGGKEQCL